MSKRSINRYIVSFYPLDNFTHAGILQSFTKALGYVEVVPNTFIWSTYNDKRYWNQVFQYYLNNNYPFIITDFNTNNSEGWLHTRLWEVIKNLP